MDRGEIWEIDLDPTLGSEQRGRRPVLVVTLKEFNQKAKIAFVCPITGGGNLARFEGFAVSLISSGNEDGWGRALPPTASSRLESSPS